LRRLAGDLCDQLVITVVVQDGDAFMNDRLARRADADPARRPPSLFRRIRRA
jgi:hypothetical protein